MFFKTFNLLFGLKCKKFDVDNINFYIDKKIKINRLLIQYSYMSKLNQITTSTHHHGRIVLKQVMLVVK